MPATAAVLSIATANPPIDLPQAEVAAAARALFDTRYPEFRRLSRVFESSGIDHRQSARPIPWFAEPHDWPERTAVYLEAADALFVDAATRALAQAGVEAHAVDQIVTVSSTGVATPSLEARAMAAMGFRPDVQRVPVFGLGCAGGVTGLSIAARLAEARPGSVVLLVALELCTLAFRLDELTKANVVATALFGDGAAAVVLRAGEVGEGLARVEGSGEHTWPESLAVMGWSVDPLGFGVIFAQSIPAFARRHVAPAIDGVLERLALTRADVGRFVCHPGGAKVIEALETALDLPAGALGLEREVLRDHGNMSSPTALFVLKRLLEGAALPDRSLLMALGPGFTASAVSLLRS